MTNFLAVRFTVITRQTPFDLSFASSTKTTGEFDKKKTAATEKRYECEFFRFFSS